MTKKDEALLKLRLASIDHFGAQIKADRLKVERDDLAFRALCEGATPGETEAAMLVTAEVARRAVLNGASRATVTRA